MFFNCNILQFVPFPVLVLTCQAVSSSPHPRKELEQPPKEEHGCIEGHLLVQ